MKLILLGVLNLATSSFSIFSYIFTLSFEPQQQSFHSFTLGSSIIFPLSVLFLTIQHLARHQDQLSCSCMMWALLKFLTISLSLAWYGFGLNLFVHSVSHFPSLSSYGWITLIYLLVYSILWCSALSLLGGFSLFLTLKQSQSSQGFWVIFLLFSIPLISSAIQINKSQIYSLSQDYGALSIMCTVLVLLSLLLSYLETKFYIILDQLHSTSLAITCMQLFHFILLPFQGFLIVLSVIWELSSHNLFQMDQNFSKVLVVFAFLMGIIAVLANPVRYYFLFHLILQKLQLTQSLVYFEKLLYQAIRGINLSSALYLIVRLHVEPIPLTFILITLCAFTFIKSLIQSKKIAILLDYESSQPEALDRFYKVLTIGIVYAQSLELGFVIIFFGFLQTFEILVILCLQAYFFVVLIPFALYFTALQLKKINLVGEEVLLDEEDLELQQIEAQVNFASVLKEVTLGDASIGECCICCEQMEKQSVSKIVQCGHLFHTSCIKNWLQTKPNCPIDRRRV